MAQDRARREYGSGSISQRKDGTWTARVVIGTNEANKPKIKALYGKTEREVKKKLKDFLLDYHKNGQIIVSKSSVENYMRNWLYNKKANELKGKSFDRLEQSVMYQVIPEIGLVQVTAIRADDIQLMLKHLKDKGLSWSSVKKAYDAVNECFRTGVEKRDLAFNPASGVSVPKQKLFDKQPEVKYYTDDEVDRLVASARALYNNGKPHYRLGDLVPLVVNTGLRTAELLGLKWEDVDVENKVLYVNSTRVLVKDRTGSTGRNYMVIEQDSGKTKSSIRTVDLNDSACTALQRLRTVTGEFEYVLSTKGGKPVNPRFPDKTLRNIAVSAGFPEEKIYGMHSLRHTFATRLFAAGVEVKVVSELLGHSNTKLTENIYIHVIESLRKKAIAKIDQK